MTERKEKEHIKIVKDEAEEVKEILNAVSTEIPALIKNIVASVFSEESGRSMGKAAAAFYKELKESGIPNDMALKMTQDYMSTFTSFGDVFKKFGKISISPEKREEIENKLSRRVEEKIARRMREEGISEDEEDEEE